MRWTRYHATALCDIASIYEKHFNDSDHLPWFLAWWLHSKNSEYSLSTSSLDSLAPGWDEYGAAVGTDGDGLVSAVSRVVRAAPCCKGWLAACKYQHFRCWVRSVR